MRTAHEDIQCRCSLICIGVGDKQDLKRIGQCQMTIDRLIIFTAGNITITGGLRLKRGRLTVSSGNTKQTDKYNNKSFHGIPSYG